MIKFGDVIKENTKEYNPNFPKVSDHSYRIWINVNFRLGLNIIHYLI